MNQYVRNAMNKLIVTTALGLVLFALPAAAADRSGTTGGTGASMQVKCDSQRTGYAAGGVRDSRCDTGAATGTDRSRSYDTQSGGKSDPMGAPRMSPDGPSGSGAGGGAGAGPGGAGGGSGSGGSGGSGG